MIWDKNKKKLEEKLSKWDDTLKEYGLKVNDEKTAVMKMTREDKMAETKIKFRGHYLKEVEKFVYLGNEINREAKIKKKKYAQEYKTLPNAINISKVYYEMKICLQNIF